MENINEQWILQDMISNRFQDEVGNVKSELVERVNYFGDKIEVVYKNGQSLIFSVEKVG
jgi:hypothetical protein